MLLATNAVPYLGLDPTLGGGLAAGENPIGSFVTRPELRNAVARGGHLRGVPRHLDELPVLNARPRVDSAINVRGRIPPGPGRFGDGVIGGQALDQGLPLISNDRDLREAVRALGGVAR